MKRNFAAIAVLAIAASGISATAQASDQLARSLGVAPGAYSTSQLVQLRDALENGDHDRAAFIIDGEAGGAANGGQLAASLGLEPGSLSNADLVALKAAVENGDNDRVAFLNGAHQVVSRDASAPSANRQLAASLGVAPGTYDNATLAALYLDATGRAED